MKRLSKALAGLLSAAMLFALTACGGGGITVSFALPDGASGTAPEAISGESYSEFTLPTADATMNNAQQTGWQDPRSVRSLALSGLI